MAEGEGYDVPDRDAGASEAAHRHTTQIYHSFPPRKFRNTLPLVLRKSSLRMTGSYPDAYMTGQVTTEHLIIWLRL
jgi:hypothetical protein